MSEYEFYCPECGKKADIFRPYFIKYSMIRLELPIFCCDNCRLIYKNEATIRRLIREWKKESPLAQIISFKKLYEEFSEKINEMINTHFVPRLGYKKMVFIKKRVKKTL